MPDLPPLSAVRVFEAVARHGNLTRAATELNMTQSAVSYQIRQLEAFAGAPLLLRQARGVALNERGQAIAPVIARALAEISQALKAARLDADNLLVISTMQTFAGGWLAQRLGNFQLAHRDLAVRLDVSNRVSDLPREGIDVAIRTGTGEWPGLASHFLMQLRYTAVCSPSYLEREGRPATPADTTGHTLVAPADDWWQDWFELAGLPRSTAITRRGIDVDTQNMAINLAISGHGITLASPDFVKDDIRTGRLVQLFDTVVYSGVDYYLVYAQEYRNRPKIRAFRDWVLKEMGQE